MKLETLLQKKISSGFKRKAMTSCSKWAETYRVMGKPFPGPWTFDHHPWLRDMHDSKADMNVGQKSAQMGFTEMLLNWTFYHIDINAESVLYLLPTDDNAGEFSASRFDPALEASEHLSMMFSDVKNIKHKRAGTASLFIRGTRSVNKLISIPVGRIAMDEVDRMVLKNIPLVWERMSGQVDKQVWMISTPTAPKIGINEFMLLSTQEHEFFKCPRCSRSIELLFPRNMIITAESETDDSLINSHLICHKCKGTLVHETKFEWLTNMEWVPSFHNMNIRGFYINQLYSHTMEPWRFARAYLRSLSNPADEQEFYNQKCGEPHLVEGARIELEDIEKCFGAHKNGTKAESGRIVTMGVDVGKWLHLEIDEWNFRRNGADIHKSADPRVLYVGKVVDFTELEKLMYDYGINYCVIDANPERRKALEFCNTFLGAASMCFYGREQKGREITEGKEMPSVTVDRTSWLDLSLSRFTASKKTISVPHDTPKEYKDHLQALVKIYEKDADGNPVAKYINGGHDDHFAHARNYSEIALSMAAATAQSQNMRSPI